jgi:hypothetical protein
MCNPIECIAACFSVIGGCFVPSVNPLARAAGFGLWICGNLGWLYYTKDKKVLAFMTMQLIYLGQNVVGILNNLGFKVF